MSRYIGVVVALALAAGCLSPTPVRAWSETPAPTNLDGTARFSDPDERLERMSGRSGSGEREMTRSLGGKSGGWSFFSSQTSQPDRSPMGSMFTPGSGGPSAWPDRQR